MARWKSIGLALAGSVFAFSAWGQSSTDRNSSADDQEQHRRQPGPAREIGAGASAPVTGAAKGAGEVAKGTGKGVVEAVTLHPINAATSVGKGAAVGGKDVAVGAAKGGGKIVHGVGRAFKKIF